MNQAFQGHLKSDSPLRAIFTDGMIPLTTPLAHDLTAGGRSMRAYLCSLRHVTDEQKTAMARRMEEMGQGKFEDALADLKRDHELPIREDHFNGSSFPLRFVL